MGKKIEITRRTKLGFGYTSACEQTEQGLQVCKVVKPDYVGTVKTLTETIKNDRTLQSFRGGTYYNTTWFVKVEGEWKEFIQDFQNPSIHDLLTTNKEIGNDEPGFYIDSVTVELV